MTDEDLVRFNTWLSNAARQKWGGIPGNRGPSHDDGGEKLHYVTISIGGLKPEGTEMPSRPTVFQAADALFAQIDAYLSGRMPIWREYPWISCDGQRFYAIARLVAREAKAA